MNGRDMPATAQIKTKKRAASKGAITRLRPTVPRGVIAQLGRHILVDGFKLVIDLEQSRGSCLVDARTGREFVDLYSFFASMPVGYGHPHFSRPEVEADLLAAAKVKVASADVYSVQYATFIETFARVMGLPPLERYFFIEGGAAAVENALKAAMDWKVRKNLAVGRGERGTEILHFERAFHGRSGYTMSLTNTELRKTQYFAKFPWPRVPAPAIDHALPPAERGRAVAAKEKQVEAQIREIIAQKGTDIAAIIIEPIQGEGGDNHFRGEWLRALRQICDESDVLLIFDEIQCGMGLTGKNWCCQHFDVLPDLLVFGKKAQVCGVMAGPRLDDVKDNVFRLPSRINSTWGGNFTDFVRSTHFLRIIETQKLVDNARRHGERFHEELHALTRRHGGITGVRGRGLMLAFDLPDPTRRDVFWKGVFDLGLLVLRSGERSVRLRPVLDVTDEVMEKALQIMDKQCRRMGA
jgi:L-lysine 6-transaminase